MISKKTRIVKNKVFHQNYYNVDSLNTYSCVRKMYIGILSLFMPQYDNYFSSDFHLL